MQLGAHVSTAGGIATGLRRGAEMGCAVVQIFTQSPRMWRPTAYADADLDAYAEAQAESPIGATFCHATYLINLATATDTLLEQSVACLRNNLRVASRIGSAGLVLHVGSHRGDGLEPVIDQVATALVGSLDAVAAELGRPTARVLIENAAGSGGTVGRSFEELAALLSAAGGDERLGICLDTQHLFASGIDYRSRAAADGLVKAFDRTVGLARLACVHLNDSKVAFGSNRDRHENVGDGLIGDEGLGWLCSHPKLRKLPAMLEVPGAGEGPRREDLERARAMIEAGEARRRRR